MKRIFERIVVGDAFPSSDSLWIDTKLDPLVFKMSFDGNNWIELNVGSDNDDNALRIDINNPDGTNEGADIWYLSLNIPAFENVESVSLTVDNFENSPVLLTKKESNVFGCDVIVGDIKYVFALFIDIPALPNGYNSGVSVERISSGAIK